jgi:hypothetical protein
MKPVDWDTLGRPIYSPLDVAIASLPIPILPPMLCKCPDTYTKVLGDGCDICNPELAKEMKE